MNRIYCIKICSETVKRQTGEVIMKNTMDCFICCSSKNICCYFTKTCFYFPQFYGKSFHNNLELMLILCWRKLIKCIQWVQNWLCNSQVLKDEILYMVSDDRVIIRNSYKLTELNLAKSMIFYLRQNKHGYMWSKTP